MTGPDYSEGSDWHTIMTTATRAELAAELLRVREELERERRGVRALVESGHTLDVWNDELQAENAALQAKLDRVVEAMIPTVYIVGKGDRKHCLRCDIWWVPGAEHKHRDGCPLAEEATDG